MNVILKFSVTLCNN